MSDPAFRWFDGDANTRFVVKPARAVAVYINADNNIVIRQEAFDDESDPVVVVPLERVSALVKALRELAAKARSHE